MNTVLSPGIYPFWFWNDWLEADEIRRQVSEMAVQGIKGFFIHPRQGLRQPYLSESYFQMVAAAVTEAERRGLSVSFNDEYPYPTGAAGGGVFLGDPRFYATALVHQSYDTGGGRVRFELPPGQVLSACVYPVVRGRPNWKHGRDVRSFIGVVLTRDSYLESGLTVYSRKRYFSSEPAPVLEMELDRRPQRVLVSLQVEVSRCKYWKHYTDVLNPEAIRRFIGLTHERMKERFGGKFGRSIVSVFADEIAPGWSAGIPAAFRKEYGYDLIEFLPALQDASHPDHIRVVHDLGRLKYRLFERSFERPVARWCRANRLLYVGEKGSFTLSQLRHMDIPGCDAGHIKAGAVLDLLGGTTRGNARAAVSAAYFYGKAGSLCEWGHSLGWGATMQDAKLIMEGLLLMGITHQVPHAFFYSTHGLRKHDAPPSFFLQNSWWRLFGRLSERIARITEHFAGTRIDAQVLLVEPSGGLPDAEQLKVYVRIQELLLKIHRDFLLVDDDILRRAANRRGRVCLKEIAAGVILVPPMRIRSQFLRTFLDGFRKKGGLVVECEAGTDWREIADQVAARVPPALRVVCSRGGGEGLCVVRRVSRTKTLWFVLNTTGRTLRVRIDAGVDLEEIPLDESPPELARHPGGYIRTIQPFESFLLRPGRKSRPGLPAPVMRIPLSGRVHVRLEGKNLLRLDKWKMTLLQEGGSLGESAPVTAVPLDYQLERGHFGMTPVISRSFGSMPELAMPPVRVLYETTFVNRYRGHVALVMEPGSIAGDWRLSVNGGRAWDEKAMRSSDAHVRGSRERDITAELKPGRNILRVEVTADSLTGGLLNPLYLAGDFGVLAVQPTLTAPGGIGFFEDYRANRCPYYAGVIEYETAFTVKQVPVVPLVQLQLDYGRPFQEASEISVNGSPFVPVLWEPRRVSVPSDRLKPGKNRIAIRVHAPLSRSFDGTFFDYTAHAYRPVDSGE